MTFTLTAISPSTVPENGGQKVQISGAFELENRYRVHIGELGSVSDPQCYSGIPGQGNIVYPVSNVLTCYTPLLTPDLTMTVTVINLDTSETHTLVDAVTTSFRDFRSKVFALRKVLPVFYRTGARRVELANRPVIDITALPPDLWPGCFWNFTGNFVPTDRLSLPYASGGQDFQPGSGDFTAIAIFKPKTVLTSGRLISVAKTTSANEVSWQLYPQANGVLRVRVRKSALLGGESNAFVAGASVLDQSFMAVIRYHYTGDGTSDLYVHAISAAYATKTALTGNAVGPIADFGGRLDIGSMEDWSTGNSITCEFYAAAYWDSLIALADLEEVWAGTKSIFELSPRLQVNFCRSVAATYEAETGTGPNAPYILDVHGNPTKG